MFMVSLIMLSGDCESLKTFILWHLVWFIVLVFSALMIVNVEGKEE
jgi:hypothetical protein